jgi:hypothetical protein
MRQQQMEQQLRQMQHQQDAKRRLCLGKDWRLAALLLLQLLLLLRAAADA